MSNLVLLKRNEPENDDCEMVVASDGVSEVILRTKSPEQSKNIRLAARILGEPPETFARIQVERMLGITDRRRK